MTSVTRRRDVTTAACSWNLISMNCCYQFHCIMQHLHATDYLRRTFLHPIRFPSTRQKLRRWFMTTDQLPRQCKQRILKCSITNNRTTSATVSTSESVNDYPTAPFTKALLYAISERSSQHSDIPCEFTAINSSQLEQEA